MWVEVERFELEAKCREVQTIRFYRPARAKLYRLQIDSFLPFPNPTQPPLPHLPPLPLPGRDLEVPYLGGGEGREGEKEMEILRLGVIEVREGEVEVDCLQLLHCAHNLAEEMLAVAEEGVATGGGDVGEKVGGAKEGGEGYFSAKPSVERMRAIVERVHSQMVRSSSKEGMGGEVRGGEKQ